MRDVVVIGGGLSGLAAAYELEKAGVAYTLIEVKPRLGGSAGTEHSAGFPLDFGLMAHPVRDPDVLTRYLRSFNLHAALFPVDVPGDTRYAFTGGTGALVDALAARLHGPVMKRMAVSTLGELSSLAGASTPRRFSICMENGMLLDARALIIAAPARYAERMLHTLVPEAAYLLLDYRYDNIARVSLAYALPEVMPLPDAPPAGYPVTTLHAVTDPRRVPDGYTIVQVGVRYEPSQGMPVDLVGELAALMGWPQNPRAEQVGIWPEADPIMWMEDSHAATMERVRMLLPTGVALVGSDYLTWDGPPALDERLVTAQAAARRIIEWL